MGYETDSLRLSCTPKVGSGSWQILGLLVLGYLAARNLSCWEPITPVAGAVDFARVLSALKSAA